MNNLFIKYDIENDVIVAGPQGSQPDDSWVPYIPAQDLKFRQATSLHWHEETGAVYQIAGDEHVKGYAEQRRNAYPKLSEQLDKLFHDIDSGTLDATGEFYTAIQAVKDAHPKPE